MSDGAAAAIVMSAERPGRWASSPWLGFLGFATAGVPPELMGSVRHSRFEGAEARGV